MTDRWYYEILGHRDDYHDDNFDDGVLDLTSPGVTDVHIYDADYFDKGGYLQDRDVGGELPDALQVRLSEEEESKFEFNGTETELISLMEEHGIKPLPVGKS